MSQSYIDQKIMENLYLRSMEDNDWFVTVTASGLLEEMEILLEQGVDIDIFNKNGTNGLLGTSCRGNISTMKFLLENGANSNIQNDKGWTPLIYASISGNIEGVQLLLEYGADPNIQNNEGNTALSYAILGRDDSRIHQGTTRENYIAIIGMLQKCT